MKMILHKIVLSSLVSLTLFSMVACHDAVRTPRPTPDMADIAGCYALVSVNAKSVPTTVIHEGATLEVRAGTCTFGTDGRCRTTTVFVPPSGREVVREVGAVYSKAGAELTMRWDGAGMTTGSVDGNIFTMHNEGMVFVYRK